MFTRTATILTVVMSIIFSTAAFSKSSFDHSHKSWDKLLKKYVTKNDHYNRLDYRALKNEIDNLKAYTQSLSKVTKSNYENFSRDEKLAFLINAYNAFVVQAVTSNYPIKKILDLRFFGSGPWDKKNISLLETKFSLNMIEKEYIIPKFKEARIHFAINCASVGCPSIQNFAFNASSLESQLEESTIDFVTNKHRYSFDSKDNVLEVSKIFDWYKDDFKRQYGSVQKLFVKYLNNNKMSSAKIDYKHYSWDLNE